MRPPFGMRYSWLSERGSAAGVMSRVYFHEVGPARSHMSGTDPSRLLGLRLLAPPKLSSDLNLRPSADMGQSKQYILFRRVVLIQDLHVALLLSSPPLLLFSPRLFCTKVADFRAAGAAARDPNQDSHTQPLCFRYHVHICIYTDIARAI